MWPHIWPVSAAPLRKRVDETLGRFVGELGLYLVMVSAVLGVLQYLALDDQLLGGDPGGGRFRRRCWTLSITSVLYSFWPV